MNFISSLIAVVTMFAISLIAVGNGVTGEIFIATTPVSIVALIAGYNLTTKS